MAPNYPHQGGDQPPQPTPEQAITVLRGMNEKIQPYPEKKGEIVQALDSAAQALATPNVGVAQRNTIGAALVEVGRAMQTIVRSREEAQQTPFDEKLTKANEDYQRHMTQRAELKDYVYPDPLGNFLERQSEGYLTPQERAVQEAIMEYGPKTIIGSLENIQHRDAQVFPNTLRIIKDQIQSIPAEQAEQITRQEITKRAAAGLQMQAAAVQQEIMHVVDNRHAAIAEYVEGAHRVTSQMLQDRYTGLPQLIEDARTMEIRLATARTVIEGTFKPNDLYLADRSFSKRFEYSRSQELRDGIGVNQELERLHGLELPYEWRGMLRTIQELSHELVTTRNHKSIEQVVDALEIQRRILVSYAHADEESSPLFHLHEMLRYGVGTAELNDDLHDFMTRYRTTVTNAASLQYPGPNASEITKTVHKLVNGQRTDTRVEHTLGQIYLEVAQDEWTVENLENLQTAYKRLETVSQDLISYLHKREQMAIDFKVDVQRFFSENGVFVQYLTFEAIELVSKEVAEDLLQKDKAAITELEAKQKEYQQEKVREPQAALVEAVKRLQQAAALS